MCRMFFFHFQLFLLKETIVPLVKRFSSSCTALIFVDLSSLVVPKISKPVLGQIAMVKKLELRLDYLNQEWNLLDGGPRRDIYIP